MASPSTPAGIPSGRLSRESVCRGLTPRRVGRVIRVLDETGSTNEDVLSAAADRSLDGLVVLAEHQRAGRGRLGRQWLSPRGASVLCSALVFLDEAPAWACRATLIGAVAACDAARAAGVGAAEIKWPNDVVVRSKKLGGVLVESRRTDAGHVAYAIGVGINCLQRPAHWPPELRGKATSLDAESDQPVDRALVARTLIATLDDWLATPQQWDDADLKEAWRRRARGVGGRVRLRSDGREFAGSVIDIDPAAGLVVELDTGGRRHFDPARTTLL